MTVERGDFVQLNGRVGVVFLTGAELGQGSEDHAAVWFGAVEDGSPDVWLVPADLLRPGPEPNFRH